MKKLAILSICITIYMISCNNSTMIKDSDLKSSEKLMGLEYTDIERDSLIEGLDVALEDYEINRQTSLKNNISPKLFFDPRPIGYKNNKQQQELKWSIPSAVEMPENINEIAFYSIPELASLIQQKKVTSTELTKFFINRLKRHSDTLECLVTLTEELALKQAKQADEDLKQGIYRGPLHGIPYGVKDLFAVAGYKTTWGAAPYKSQQMEQTAEVVQRLENAGGVLIAKLTLGALAMGDVWYDGVTKNPWDLSQGSSGSSAGSASATAAGLVPFAIGTETWGSIVSPATRCGVTGLRSTFGTVSRDGAMALSWSMDKVGPICRSAYDCAIVFDAIRGKDPKDQVTVDYPFNYAQDLDVENLKVGYLKDLFYGKDYRGKQNDSLTIETLKSLGVKLTAVNLPDTIEVYSLAIILEAEAGAAFDELTRSNKDDELVAQHKNAWPNIFRKSRFIPAVEYIQANRIRSILIEEFNQFIQEYDVVVCPSFGGSQLLMTNLTGHPCVVVPNGFDEDKHPTSISFIGNLYDEATLLAFAKKFQDSTEFDDQHPEYFK